MEVIFKKWKCNLVFRQYSNQRIAIELMNANPIKESWGIMEPNTESIAVATVNLPNINMRDNEIAIKSYSENDTMLETLVDAGVVSKPVRWIKSGFVEIPVCNLLISPYGN